MSNKHEPDVAARTGALRMCVLMQLLDVHTYIRSLHSVQDPDESLTLGNLVMLNLSDRTQYNVLLSI